MGILELFSFKIKQNYRLEEGYSKASKKEILNGNLSKKLNSVESSVFN